MCQDKQCCIECMNKQFDKAVKQAASLLHKEKPKESMEDCITRNIKISKLEHPEWNEAEHQTKAKNWCEGHMDEKAMSAIDDSAGGTLVGDDKKKYHLTGVLKGKKKTFRQGHEIPYGASDFQIHDAEDKVFDNHTFKTLEAAEGMLIKLL